MDSRHAGLVVLWHVESSWTKDQTCVPCIGRRIPIHYTTGEILKESINFHKTFGNIKSMNDYKQTNRTVKDSLLLEQLEFLFVVLPSAVVFKALQNSG